MKSIGIDNCLNSALIQKNRIVMRKNFTKVNVFILVLICTFSYAYSVVLSDTSPRLGSNSSNTVLLKVQESCWQNLFNGENLDGWHVYNSDKSINWSVKDGIMFSNGGNGDIVTDSEFENFELEVEWKINKGGNSGVFYYVQEEKQYKYLWHTGPEFQIIDDESYPGSLLEKQKTGSCSDVLPPTKLASHAPGEWNYARIIVFNGNVEHWLNGELVLRYSMDSEFWKDAVKGSKFSDLDYAKVRKGRIGLQDHGSPIYFRKIRIHEL